MVSLLVYKCQGKTTRHPSHGENEHYIVIPSICNQTSLHYPMFFNTTVFPQIRPAGIIFLQGLQMRVLLERGYLSRAGIIIRIS